MFPSGAKARCFIGIVTARLKPGPSQNRSWSALKLPPSGCFPTAIYAQRQLPHPNVEEHDVRMGHPTSFMATSFLVLPARCRDPSLGVLGFAKDSAASG